MIVRLAETYAKYYFLNLIFILLFILLLLLPFIPAVLKWFFPEDVTPVKINRVKQQGDESANDKVNFNNVVDKNTSVT
ncbi:hypothetical protein ACILPN_06255 [Yersinia wautersii]|uniref:Uncharacterized protein n=1 Tax=Yersinia pseudotuberculosis TaxID=633 RepID=A0A380Q3D7_YERPU|nr:hypothetical protein [Yersinia pseudotuberculosis]CND29967.1 Uncharacterised protein [Yersinia pseudotuberculosis]SUP80296.1 Uncharacterised protein [Yersinia pseudotuberculosis]